MWNELVTRGLPLPPLRGEQKPGVRSGAATGLVQKAGVGPGGFLPLHPLTRRLCLIPPLQASTPASPPLSRPPPGRRICPHTTPPPRAQTGP